MELCFCSAFPMFIDTPPDTIVSKGMKEDANKGAREHFNTKQFGI